MELAQAKILIVDDVAGNREVLQETLEPKGYEILLAPSGELGLKAARKARPDLILLDIMMPGMDGYETCRRLKADGGTEEIPVIFITAKDETSSMVQGFELGAVDYITKPFQADEVLARVATHLKVHHLTRELRNKNQELEEEITRRQQAEEARETSEETLSAIAEREEAQWGIAGFVGRSPTFERILNDVQRLTSHNAARVLITGESGTGKELVARAVHFRSRRSKGPFIPINCSTIPGELAESLLFGHVKGAFSGAISDRRGYFELAHGGTLFLDEISEMPPPLQAKLLRVLEDGEVLPLGTSQVRRVEIHLVAATNADFHRRIDNGTFRKDLYFRLAGFEVQIPPLRERIEDIPLLTDHFLDIFSREMGFRKPALSDAAAKAVRDYDYPGNIRELKNILERALMESEGQRIELSHLHFFSLHPRKGASEGAADAEGTMRSPSPDSRLSGPSGNSEEDRILRYVSERGSITNSQCRTLLDKDRHHATYVLQKMQESGALISEGQGRWVQYRRSQKQLE